MPSGASDRPIIRHRGSAGGTAGRGHREERAGRWALAAAGVLLVALVLWAPLPFGSVEPEAEAALRLACAVLLALAVPAVRRHRLAPVALPAASLAGLGVFGFLQTLPLPRGLVRLLSPRHAETWGAMREILAAHRDAGLAGEGPLPGWPRLTLDPAATRDVAITLLALAALLVAAALVGRDRRWRRLLAGAVVVAGLFQVIYGLRQLLAGSMEVWGVPVLGMSGRLRGTFVNPNHAAYLLEMALAVAFATGWWAAVKARRESSLETRLVLLLPPIVVILGLLGGLSLTQSRAGLVAVLVSMAVQVVLVALAVARRPERRGRWSSSAFAAAAAAGLVALGIGAGIVSGEALSRLLGTSLSEVALGARSRVAALTFDLWVRFPLVGSGLGTFRDAFPALQPADLEAGAWLHAHNDYLELLATAGLLGAAVVAVGVAALLRRLLRVLAHGRRSEDRAAALAALGALGAMAVHEAFDFGLTLPGNVYVLVALCGAAAAARTVRR